MLLLNFMLFLLVIFHGSERDETFNTSMYVARFPVERIGEMIPHII
jgi:hypothetical protein